VSSISVLLLAMALLAAVTLALAWLRPQWLADGTMTIARRAVGLRRKVAWAAGFRLVYVEAGRGEPLLLLHGLGADKDGFLLVARALSRYYRVIVPDLPGFGESERPPGVGYSLAEQVSRLQAFCRELGIDRCHLGGNSMGGLLAGAYAARHPGQVLSLWLLAPAGVKAAQPSELMQAIADGRPLPILARTIAEVRALFTFVMHRPPPMPRYMLATLALRQSADYELNSRIVQELVDGPGLDELLGADAPPALVVWGDRDRALHPSGAAVLASRMPKARLILMPDVGHVPMMEAPATVVRDYLAFRRDLRAG